MKEKLMPLLANARDKNDELIIVADEINWVGGAKPEQLFSKVAEGYILPLVLNNPIVTMKGGVDLGEALIRIKYDLPDDLELVAHLEIDAIQAITYNRKDNRGTDMDVFTATRETSLADVTHFLTLINS